MTLKRTLSLFLAALMLLGALSSAPLAVTAASDDLTNVARGQSVTATSDYVAPEGFYSASFLTDGHWETYAGGNVKLGWNSIPMGNIGEYDAVDITITLDAVYILEEIILKPMKWDKGKGFPRDYELMVSEDGSQWSTVAQDANMDASAASNTAVQPISYDISPAKAKYFRMHITRHSASRDTNTGAYYSSMGEIELMGSFDATAEENTKVTINKTALRMQPGEYDYLKLQAESIHAQIPAVTWTSDDPKVATIDADGKVTAVAFGETTLRGKTVKEEFTCTILVDDHSMLDNLMITTFRSPSKPHLTPETYDLLKAAGFTNIQNEWNTSVNTVADNLLMAQYSYERGMDITASLGDWRDGFAGLSYEEVQERVSIFSHVPGVGGIYILDEPYNANPYASAFEPIKDLMPYADVHLNFLPLGSYGDPKTYTAQINDLYQLTGGRLDYLMYDHYPFNTVEGYMNEASWFQNLDVVRELGLKTGAKTGTFILSISMRNGYRRPTGDEIRYEMYTAMAYGYKQLAYFCWETPNEIDYGFGPAIVDVNGEPTEIYEPVKEVNNEALKLGPTLMQLECVEPYLVGDSCGYDNWLPEDFFLQPNDGAQLVVSHMRNPDTDEDYCFVVNRQRYTEQTVTLIPAAYVASMQEVSNQTGALEDVTRNADGTYTVTLRPGAGRLFKMPDTCNYTPDFMKFVVEDGENLALDGNVRASGSVGAEGFYQYYANDGERFSRTAYRGWDSTVCADQKAWVQVDMGGVTDINRVDLYPAGTDSLFGQGFPTDFTIDVSKDGETWQTVVTVSDYDQPSAVPTFTFDTTETRYVRVSITGMQQVDGAYRARLSEIEIYCDDGTLPPPEAFPVKDPNATSGTNLAPDATVIHSSTYEYPPYWSADSINDGKYAEALSTESNAGWSSDENTDQNATEWIGYDLGTPQLISKVIAYNAFDTVAECFPIDYHVEVSLDGEEWQTVYEVTGDMSYAEQGSRVMMFDPVKVRYVRFVGTKLSSKTGQSPFRMQLSELEVMKAEPVDLTALNTAVSEVEAMDLSVYTEESRTALEATLTVAKTVLADGNTTQAQADEALAALQAARDALVELTTDTEPVTEPITESATEQGVGSAEVTEPVTEGETHTPEDQGCGSALLSCGVLTAALAAAVCLSKHREES